MLTGDKGETALVEVLGLLIAFGSAWSSRMDTTISFGNVLCTLILSFKCLLLKLSIFLGRYDLLAAPQVLDVSPALARLLPLLLDACILALFLTDRVLLGHVHVAIIGFVETLLWLHGVWTVRVHWCESHFWVLPSICTWSDTGILTTREGIIGGLACFSGSTSLVGTRRLYKAPIVWTILLLTRDMSEIIRHLHRL